ncbi:alpha/beta fold hydrolase [Pseudomonas sp. S75]|uniref:alpha/beta fold hydrolase n=1 Tax=unclassified Pseudomonas TaxID=196821 RepID=UPI001908BAD9|nr:MULTISPECIES: alpha/beta fold hydrolase [unclassified Pseudomonas]MBJ9977075.1 alpha/beta fold hydrolase [Pseudomonas sp. S30]MBK0154077.1 alpha/beta fold hydrolase [Pseudomonas sp. S75]
MIKILIVDDSEERASIVKKALSESPHSSLMTLDWCTSADQARGKLREYYDLLILDVLIPKKLGGVPQALHSIRLLSEICSVDEKYVRPGLIIGLTADVAELSVYKEEFLSSASVVLDGSLSKRDWLDSLLKQVDALVGARIKLSKREEGKLLVTIHGIRTYGHWQSGLQQRVNEYSSDFKGRDVKYGYFDIFSFCVPILRKRKIRNISSDVVRILDQAGDKDVYIVAHSFGTLVVASALKDASLKKKIKRIILCGSPLRSDTDIDSLLQCSESVVNDCGVRDGILVLAKMLVLGLGDSGRTGFYRVQDEFFINRFFKGGHSMYFNSYENEPFFEKFWLPMIVSDAAPQQYDCRKNYIGEDLLDIVVKAFDKIKPYAYVTGAGFAIFKSFTTFFV